MSKHNRQYGTFVTKTPWYRCRKCAIGSSLILFALVSAGIVGFKAFKNKPVEQVLQIPTATASEMPGWWYKDYFGSSLCEQDNCKPDADPDNDKLSNYQEFYYHSNPLVKDTNKNGLTDGEDVAYNFDPSRPGKVTFEEVASDENILGESLVFDSDIKQLIEDMTDMDNIRLPEVNEAELNITQENTKEKIIEYILKSDAIVLKYFPNDEALSEAVQVKNSQVIEDFKIRATQALFEYKKLAVPSDALLLHKYQINLLQLSILLVDIPDLALINDPLSPVGNAWFDQAQAYAYVGQWIDVEFKKLRSKYQWIQLP